MAKKKSEETALVQSQGTEVGAVNQLEAWGVQRPVLTQNDTIVPKIIVMQGMSEKVTGGEAVFGEFRDSISNACYGSDKKPVEMIPFHMTKTWIEQEWSADAEEFEYKRTVPITAANDNLPYNEEGLRRIRSMNFFVLIPSEIEGGGLPKVVSFRVTSLKGGKKLATQMYVQNPAAGLAPPGMVMLLKAVKTKNDKGTFMVMDVEPSRKTTEAEFQAALRWYKTINAGTGYQVDAADEQSPVTVDAEIADPGEPAKF